MAQPPLDLLCIEPTFPGRLGGVADWLVRRRGYRARFYCRHAAPRDHWPESTGRGIEVVAFGVGGVAAGPDYAWPRVLERGLCYAYGCWEVLDARRPRPVDVILGRSAGLGSTLFAPVAFPSAPIVQLFDSYHDPARAEPEIDAPPDGRPEADRLRRLAANAVELLDLENGVTPWTPTEYQRGLFPAAYRGDFVVLHDGVETRGLPARGRGRLVIGGRTIPEDAPVVTYVAGSTGPRRGFDRFVGLVGRLHRESPGLVAVALAAGAGDETAATLDGVPGLDRDRLWLLGPVPPAEVRRVLARGDLHVDPSRPGPASRSLVEAMAAGSAVLAQDSEAAREIVEDGVSGRIAGDSDALFHLARHLLSDRDAARTLGDAAAERIRDGYSRDVTLPRLADLFGRLAGEA